MNDAIGIIAMLLGLFCFLPGYIFTCTGRGGDVSDVSSDVAAAGCSAFLVGFVLIGFGIWMVR